MINQYPHNLVSHTNIAWLWQYLDPTHYAESWMPSLVRIIQPFTYTEHNLDKFSFQTRPIKLFSF